MKRKPSRRKDKPQANTKEPFIGSMDIGKPQKESAFFQPKVSIGRSNDRAEKEADSVADHYVAVQKQAEEEEPAAKLIRRQAEEEEPAAKLIRKQEEEEPAAKLIRRQSLPEEEVQKKAESRTQLKSSQNEDKSAGSKLNPNLEKLIKDSKGKGKQLPDDIRNVLEAELRFDLSKVRIHNGEEASRATSLLNAQAFTQGYNIYFNKNKYNPYSKEGKHLLVHELTHVVQQKGHG